MEAALMLRVPIIPLHLSTRSGARVHQKACLGGWMLAQVGVVGIDMKK